MPTYQPNIPTGTVPLDQDYLNLQGNFQQINVAYGVDHVPLTNYTGVPPGGQSGMHTAIHQVPVSTVSSNPPNNQPINGYTAVTGYNQVISAQINDGINTDTALFNLTGGNKLQQLTRNFVPTATFTNTPATTGSGYTFLPGGLIYQFGLYDAGSGGVAASGTITFPLPFPGNIFNIQLQMISKSGGTSSDHTLYVQLDKITKTNFLWQIDTATSAVTGIYWTAIGI